MHVIGEETSQRLDVIPAQFRVIVTHRPKYACRACEEAVVQAPAPERLIKGGLPTEAMVAYVLVAKYAWHLPLYRQAQMLLAQGLDIKRAILAFWVGYAAAELKPLYLRLRELILTSGKIAVDETVAPVLDPGRGRTKKGYFWAIARDDRPWGGTDPPAIAYSYAPGRGAVHALKLLEHYRGIVQCDGYAAYKTIADAAGGEAITLAFCWAHLRRQFFDIAKGGNAPIASEALERIAALYAIEKTIRGQSADERRAVRQEKSKPLVLALKAWLEQQLARVSGKSVIAEAIRYGLEPLGRAHPLPRRRPHRARHQHRRARHPSHRAQSQERALRRPRSGSGELGLHRLAHRDLQTATASIRKPTSPTCSPSSSISGPPRASTNSCPGPGRPSAPPTNSRRDAPNRAAATENRKNQAIRAVSSEDRLRPFPDLSIGSPPLGTRWAVLFLWQPGPDIFVAPYLLPRPGSFLPSALRTLASDIFRALSEQTLYARNFCYTVCRCADKLGYS